ncbi:unnamed protein product, partial [Candidula unifasciata]
INMEGLTVLDIAVMTNNIPMAKMLLSKGARESPVFQKGECRLQRLESLVTEAEKNVIDLTAIVLNGSSGNSNISPVQLKETEKQLGHWEFRHRLLKRMKAGYNYAKPPEAPTNVQLEVTSSSSLRVSFAEPQSHNGAVVTKYKVQWSTSDSFVPLSGEAIVEDLTHLEYELSDLAKGSPYYVRVCAWNVKGYGSYSCSNPPSATASSWQEVNDVPSRLEGKVASLYTLYCQVKKSRPPDSTEMKDVLNKESDSPMQKKRISIKSFFNSTPKFQKCVKRGVYMACLLYCKDKILVTSDELLPIIEVDEMFSGPTVHTDLFWLLRISCMWEEVKILKQDMEKTSSARSTFRCKLLQAIVSLQTGLGIQDLGQFFHQPIRDTNSSIILTVVNHIRDPRLVTLGSSKWVTLGKLARRQSLLTHDLTDANSLLVNAVPDMVLYHQVSRICLPRGLYLGYVKLQASIEVLKVLVMNKAPNCVPHVKIRDCPNVTRDEWEWLLKSDRFVENMNYAQASFQQLLTDAIKKLFAQLDLPEDTITKHRIYDLEVLELSPSVAMILVLPSIEDVCIVPGYPDSLAKKADCSFLPVQIFESIHMQAYKPEFFSMYARLSTVVEMDGILAHQGHREAFSTEELSKTKEQVEVTKQLQQNLDKIWKCARWIRDITSYARNREKKAGIGLSYVFLSNTVSSNKCISVSDTMQKPLRLNIGQNSYLSTSTTDFLQSGRLSDSSDQRCIAKFYDPNEETPHSSDIISIGRASIRHQDKDATFYLSSSESTPSHCSTPQNRFSTSSLSSMSSSSSTTAMEYAQSQNSSFAIIKVHAMYDTGLNKNVNMKLHITEQTTSRDIINLIVRHLNTIVKKKGKGNYAYSEESLNNFCLVIKLPDHEQVLTDDCRLLCLGELLQTAKICVTILGTVFSTQDMGQATVV